jgi:SAM-dependent methyltransferase
MKTVTRPSDVVAEYEVRTPPPIDEQASFWDRWNQACRFKDDESPFMAREKHEATTVAQRIGLHGARILDVGCGTGWLGHSLLSFGSVTGTDLSPLSISEGTRRFPGLRLVAGDFMALEFDGPFDFIVCADALVNIPDAPAAVAKITKLLRPGGTFLLMVPNREVWRHRSALERVGEGQFMRWPPLSLIREWLRPHVVIDRIGTIEPGGDRGLLWWVENRWVRGLLGRALGRRRWQSLLETARLGRQWVIVTHRA